MSGSNELSQSTLKQLAMLLTAMRATRMAVVAAALLLQIAITSFAGVAFAQLPTSPVNRYTQERSEAVKSSLSKKWLLRSLPKPRTREYTAASRSSTLPQSGSLESAFGSTNIGNEPLRKLSGHLTTFQRILPATVIDEAIPPTLQPDDAADAPKTPLPNESMVSTAHAKTTANPSGLPESELLIADVVEPPTFDPPTGTFPASGIPEPSPVIPQFGLIESTQEPLASPSDQMIIYEPPAWKKLEGFGLIESIPPQMDSESEDGVASKQHIRALSWKSLVGQPMIEAKQYFQITPSLLYQLALSNSYRIADFRYEPWIQGTEIALADSAFDPLLYSESFFDSTSEPVGNQLTTGTADRLEEDNWRFDGGIRKATRRGGNLSMSQRLGHNTSNSDFFDPANQGTSRLIARWTQPLLRNRIMDANRSLVLTARFDTEAAQANFNQELQEVLREIAVNYWQLYRERAANVLREENLSQIREILRVLGDRRRLDVSQSQYTLAESTVRSLEAELTNAKANILNFQSQIASVVNAPELLSTGELELLPVASADLLPVEFDAQSQIAVAFSLRPELRSLEYQRQSENTLYKLACDQRKPKLDLVLEGYMASLRGGSDIPGAWAGQFTDGKPGYTGGLKFEVPYRNRAANASVRERKLRLEQLNQRVDSTKALIARDVANGIRSAAAARLESQSRLQSVQAAEQDLENLQRRWVTLSGGAVQARTQLEQLLNGHSRLLNEKLALLEALVNFNVRLVDVQFATGALVQFE
ncbi:MAG: TolC family protein [Aureliella sp.]